MKIHLLPKSSQGSFVGDFLEEVAHVDPKAFKTISKHIEHLGTYELKQLLFAGEAKKLREDLYELRIRHRGICYRILFIPKHNAYWLIHAIKKKTDKLPPRDIETALERAKLIPQ